MKTAIAPGQLDLLDLLLAEDDAPPSVVVDILHLARHLLWGWHLQWALTSPAKRAALLGTMHGAGGTCDDCGYWEHDSHNAACAVRRWAPDGVRPVQATISKLLRLSDDHAAARPGIAAEILACDAGCDPRAWPLSGLFWAPLGGAA